MTYGRTRRPGRHGQHVSRPGAAAPEYDAQWARWHEAAEAAQAAVAAHAEASGENRYELEQAVKKAVRHATEDAAE
ncbi:hypothetical protein ACIQ8G_35775 [Streptomyces sp. NPDC094154]|uniref:hypothetical protein n=1 Tax=unclassified Streptomyces TaxID=2593676 RepID=UPI00380EC924